MSCKTPSPAFTASGTISPTTETRSDTSRHPLSPRQREAIVLRYFADLSEQEIARAMGVSRGTVKSTTARGLAALGRILREEQ